MAKNAIGDFDTTPDNNADIAGIDIRGTATVRNFDNAFRTLMAALKTEQTRVDAAKAPKADPTFTGQINTGVFYGTSGAIGKSENSGAPLIVTGAGGANGAFMGFACPGQWGAYFGLDADHQFKVGGWSYGTAAYKIWHEGNDGAGSGLDADLLRGLPIANLATPNTIVVRDDLGQTTLGNKTRLVGSTPGFNFDDAEYGRNILYSEGGILHWQRPDAINPFYVTENGRFFTYVDGNSGEWEDGYKFSVRQVRKVSENYVNLQTAGDGFRRLPDGCVFTGVYSGYVGSVINITQIVYKYLQVYTVVSGWYTITEN